jgi:hypothetical protein
MQSDIETYHREAIHHEALGRQFRELEAEAIKKLPKKEPKPILRELGKKLIQLKKRLV